MSFLWLVLLSLLLYEVAVHLYVEGYPSLEIHMFEREGVDTTRANCLLEHCNTAYLAMRTPFDCFDNAITMPMPTFDRACGDSICGEGVLLRKAKFSQLPL